MPRPDRLPTRTQLALLALAFDLSELARTTERVTLQLRAIAESYGVSIPTVARESLQDERAA